jgi:hypothetical protein
MSDLAVSNNPKRIVDQLASTIRAAQIDAQPLVRRCEIIADLKQAWSDLLHGPDSIALVHPDAAREFPAPQGRIVLSVSVSILLCFRNSGTDQQDDASRALWLQAGLINAVQASPPAGLAATSDGRRFFQPLTWGPSRMRTSPAPWRCLEAPLEATVLLSSSLAH